MAAHHKQARAAVGRPSALHGVVPGSTDHRILLALRGVGGMTSDQLAARFGYHQGGALHRMKAAGLIVLPAPGQKGMPILLTQKASDLTSSTGPLNRRSTLINYCQL